jgi:5-methylcytosine-specific restriction protein A
MPQFTGKYLNKYWGIRAEHALYRKDGEWFHLLKQFPGALCDSHGYILFKTKDDFEKCQHIRLNKKTNTVHMSREASSISVIPGYRRMED